MSSETGLDLRHIPKVLRDEEGNADTRSWAALCSDSNLARPPRELLFGTTARYGTFHGVSARQGQKILREGHHHQFGNFSITLIQSEQDVRLCREAYISSARVAAGRRSGESRRGGITDVSGGTSATTALEALVSNGDS